jgi:uncharacterized membrane protein
MKTICRLLLALFMVFAGAMHFVNPEAYIKIMPPFIPFHEAMVFISGLFEIIGGIGLLFKKTQRIAAWGLVAIFIAVFPANIHMAVNNISIGEIPSNPVLLWLRLPVQIIFITWAWWFTRPDHLLKGKTLHGNF